jgi:predicted metal-binding protein
MIEDGRWRISEIKNQRKDLTDSLLKQLRAEAIRLGATAAKLIPVRSIVIDERVRLKCLVPLCDKYNQNLMCPPNLPTVEEFRKAVARYSRALFVQLAFEKNGKVTKAEARQQGLRLHKIIHALEGGAFSLGYPLAAGLIGGSCKLCKTCVGATNACRHPLMARPSMEGMGIDVIKTAKNIGLPFRFHSRNHLFWNGLLLID